MLRNEYSLFIGKDNAEGFTDFISEKGFFLVIETQEGVSKEKGKHFLETVRQVVDSTEITHLAVFEKIIAEAVHKSNLPLGISIAASYIKDEVAFLKTIGTGEIMLHRKNALATIISGDKDASGFVQENDLYILTTRRFFSLFSSEDQLKKISDNSDVFSIVDTIYEEIGEKDDTGTVALFVSPLNAQKYSDIIDDSSVPVEKSPMPEIFPKDHHFVNPFPNLKVGMGSASKKKLITSAIVSVLLVILIWSVGLGYIRRTEEGKQKKIADTKLQVQSDLSQAQDVSTSNPSRAAELIADARTKVKTLEQQLGTDKKTAVDELSQTIDAQENQIMKKEDKPSEEFYDLSVEDANAKGDAIATEGDIGAVLDRTNGVVYMLSFSKKSIQKRRSTILRSADVIALYDGKVFVFSGSKGIYTIDENNKEKKVIDTDKDWGNVVDMKLYGGNIYLLDTGKKDIVKYTAVENGYSEKKSYFKGDVPDLSSARSLAIDSSLYLALSSSLVKYTGGLAASFSTNYPRESISPTRVITNADLEKLYIWDKSASSITILKKEGEFEKEVHSSPLKDAQDVVIISNVGYILSQGKIYKLTL